MTISSMQRTASLSSFTGSYRSSPSFIDDCASSATDWDKAPEKRLPTPRSFWLPRYFLLRKSLLWTVLSLVIVSLVVLQFGHASTELVVVQPNPPRPWTDAGVDVNSRESDEEALDQGLGRQSATDAYVDELSAEQDEQDRIKLEEAIQKTPWLRFPLLKGYYFGIRALVGKSRHIPEYPNTRQPAPIAQLPALSGHVPKHRPYNPYPYEPSIRECYLDPENRVPAPGLYAYEGVPQHMPDAAIGSYTVLGIRDDVCFDRFGRYGPYGLGHGLVDGATGEGLDTEDSGTEAVWAESGQINYDQVDWSDAQERCFALNKHRFLEPNPDTDELTPEEGKKARTAIVVRLYTGFEWTPFAILNFRALVTELSLKSGGDYAVHFLLHVRDDDIPIWADDVTVQNVLNANVPPEFHGLVTLWNEAQMRLVYAGRFDEPLSNPSGAPVHGVYRSAHLPLQTFALDHPDYQHFWNWEVDMRYLGNYYELFDRVGRWADEQPRKLLWERSARYYIPSYHGSWENFTLLTEQDVLHSGQPAIFGPLSFKGKKTLRQGPGLPASCVQAGDECGIGEAADIITLNPIFDVEGSGWVFTNDVTGYVKDPSPPRRSSIITASRMSRRLLLAMHEEVWRNHRTMFTEMFPPTVALHHGLKAVYAPHPVFLERGWDPPGSAVAEVFNGGRDRSTSGPGSPFHLWNEHNHRGTSYYYNSEFAGSLWRRWLGLAQPGQGGDLKGGKEGGGGSGRMCLRSMLVHPIKFESGEKSQ